MSGREALREAGRWTLLMGCAAILGVGALASQVVPDTAQSDTITYLLEPLVVTGERERSAPPPVVALVLNPTAIRRSQESDPYRILRQTAGVEVHDQGQGPGFASNVVMRGFTSDHSSDVLLVIDGVPVNLPAHGHVEGYADWNVLMPLTVSSMRVIHGSASPLYGDFALGGVVEVFTRADAERFEGSLGITSFGDVEAEIGGGRRSDGSGFFVGGGYRRVEGWRDNAQHWVANGLVRGWRSVGEGRLEGGVSLYGTEWSSPGFISVPRFNVPDLNRATDVTDGGDSYRGVLHGRYSVPLSTSAYLQMTAWGMASDYAIFLNIPGHNHGGADGVIIQSGEWDERVGAGGRVEVGFTQADGDLVVGLSGRGDGVDYRHAATFERTVLNPELALDAGHRAGALYSRWRREFNDRLGADLGARLDILHHRSLSRLVAGAVEETSTRSVLSPKLGLRYALAPRLSLRASSARGFRSPVGIIGDPTRELFLSWSHEVGLDLDRDRWTGSLSLFRVTVDNERIQDPITFQISSAGSSARQGVSLLGALDVNENTRVEVRGTYDHARLSAPYANAHDDHPHTVFGSGESTTTTGDVADDLLEVPGVAKYQGYIRAQTELRDDLTTWVSWRGVGSHVPIGEPTVRTQPYSVADLGVSYDLGEGREFNIELLNLTDQRYVELRSAGYVTPGAPRSLRAQVRWSGLER